MKNLEKNKNIYVIYGRFYVDYKAGDGTRIRRATGLKKSSLAFDFIRKNYDLFMGSKADIEKAQREYYKLEDIQTDRFLRKGEENNTRIKNTSDFSFDSVIDKILAEKSFLKDGTRNLYNTISTFVIEFLNSKNLFYLSDFKREHSIDFIKFCNDKNFKKSTIILYCSFFKSIFSYGVNNDLIAKNLFFVPKFKDKFEDLNDEVFLPFSLDEMTQLIKNSNDELRTYLIIAFFTGARTGEILALTYGDLDFEKRQIKINKTLSARGKVDSPKTKSSNRMIDMLDIVYNELIKFKDFDKNERIFTSSRWQITNKFINLQKKLNISIRKLYDTRHSFASVMLSRGEEPMWVGCKMMGHKDLNETYQSYAKYLPKEIKQRAVFLNDLVI